MSLAHGLFFSPSEHMASPFNLYAGMEFLVCPSVLGALLHSSAFGRHAGASHAEGSYFAITTMCLGGIIYLIAGNWMELTGELATASWALIASPDCRSGVP